MHWAIHSLWGQGWKLVAIGAAVGKDHTSVIHHLHNNCTCLKNVDTAAFALTAEEIGVK